MKISELKRLHKIPQSLITQILEIKRRRAVRNREFNLSRAENKKNKKKKNMKRCSKIREKKESHVMCGFLQQSSVCKCYTGVRAL